MRLDDVYREDLEKLRRLSINLPAGGRRAAGERGRHSSSAAARTRSTARTCGGGSSCSATSPAAIWPASSPTFKQRLAPIEDALRASQRLLHRIRRAVRKPAAGDADDAALGHSFRWRCMFLALYTLFSSVNLSLQVLAALPMAAIGAVAALVVTGQSLTVASMVGFISLAGIASRNGILLIAHYLHLVRYEGEAFHAADDRARRQGAAGADADDRADGGHRARAAGAGGGRAGQGNPVSGGDGDPRRT